jgi:hypothetical protein
MTPDWLPLAHRLHVAGMAAGTALLIWLAYRMVRYAGCSTRYTKCSGPRRRLAGRYPAFFFCLLIGGARWAQWALDSPDSWYRASDSVLLAAKVLTSLEAFIMLFPRPRVPTLGVLALVAVTLGSITLLLPHEPNSIREFLRYRQAIHVGLAAFTAAGCGWLWRRPRAVATDALAHWRILTFGMVSQSALGFINYQAAITERAKWMLYYGQAGGYLLAGMIGSILWIRWVNTSSRGQSGGSLS